MGRRQAASAPADDTSRGAVVGITVGAATMFLLLRLLAVSDWNWRTAAKIADFFDFSDAFPVLLGTMLGAPGLTGGFLVILMPLAAMHAFWPARSRSPSLPRFGPILAIVALAAATVSWTVTFRSAWVVLGAAVVAIALTSIRLLWRKGVAHRAVVWLLRSVGMLALIGALGIAAIVDEPWMSRERIVLDDRTVTGYVLEVQPGFVEVLTEDREVLILRADEIASRTITNR